MRRILALVAVSSTLALAGCVADGGSNVGDDEALEQSDVDVITDKAIMPTIDSAVSGAAVTQAGINYHNGPVMTNPIHLYYIWYGNWAGNTATTILTDLANGLGGSGYWNINSTYTNAGGTKVSGSVSLVQSIYDNYSKGTKLTDAAIKSVVSSAITSGKLPADADGIYLVLTSADVTATSGFCTKYCGWHTHASISGKDIKYSFVGNSDRCPSNCSMQQAPNGNAGADGMASIISHEVEEAATDPDLNAWYDSSGAENADKCAWTFDTVSGSAGAQYNMSIGGRNFLIQQNWVNAGAGYCAKSY